MPLLALIQDLAHAPRLSVAPPPAPLRSEHDAARAALMALDAERRLEAPLTPPALSVETALWAARTLYRALQALVFRETPEAALEAALAERPEVEATRASAAWSADLALRVLPEVEHLARAASPEDPLVNALRALGRRFPLSSVGVPGTDACDPRALEAILDDRSLSILYVDRVIERRDGARMGDARVRERVLAALGAHGEVLAPEVWEQALALESAAAVGAANGGSGS